jgi:hypothetical protein
MPVPPGVPADLVAASVRLEHTADLLRLCTGTPHAFRETPVTRTTNARVAGFTFLFYIASDLAGVAASPGL